MNGTHPNQPKKIGSLAHNTREPAKIKEENPLNKNLICEQVKYNRHKFEVKKITLVRFANPFSYSIEYHYLCAKYSLTFEISGMSLKKVKSALISVYHKTGLEEILQELRKQDVVIYSTGGTQKFIEAQGVEVQAVETLTSYPSILDGRVKTLHPKIFGGLLARREENHLAQLAEYDIPELDLVIVDLYPFEETVASTDDEATIIEKIDIGGISLIRAAAKNFQDVVVVPSQNEYPELLEILREKNGFTDKADRKQFAKKAFEVSSHYDVAIFNYFADGDEPSVFKRSVKPAKVLRYGENPHQQGIFYGELEDLFDIHGGKALSFNNLVDIDAAVSLMAEFKDEDPTFAILKHTNACGLATRETINEAWHAALACDNISAFGGILIANRPIDEATATEINNLFYEVLIAPSFDDAALAILSKKKKRILMSIKHWDLGKVMHKNLLNGVLLQDRDTKVDTAQDFSTVTDTKPTDMQIKDLEFASICAKHLKSNTIALVKNKQMIGMGCGQTSRVDSCNQAIAKAKQFGFDIEGAVMASDAFFPFPDCVEIAHKAGIRAVVQPGGSINDKLSIAYCNEHNIPMVLTGTRHFKH